MTPWLTLVAQAVAASCVLVGVTAYVERRKHKTPLRGTWLAPVPFFFAYLLRSPTLGFVWVLLVCVTVWLVVVLVARRLLTPPRDL